MDFKANPELVSLFQRMGNFYYFVEDYNKSEEVYLHAIKIIEEVQGVNSIEIARALSQLGSIYKKQNRSPEVENIYKRIIRICKTVDEKSLSEAAFYLVTIAKIYEEQERNNEAEFLYKEALSNAEKMHGVAGYGVSYFIERLVNFYRNIGKEQKAIELEKRLGTIQLKLKNEQTDNS